MKNIVLRLFDRIANAEAILLVPVIGLLVLDSAGRLQSLFTANVSAAKFLIASEELLVGLILLWATASRWAKGAAPLMFLGAFRALIALGTGTTMSYRHEQAPRIESASIAVFLIVGGVLMVPYMSRKPNSYESLAIVAFVFFGLPAGELLPTHPLAVVASASIGVAVLGVTRLMNRAARSVHHGARP